MATGASTFSISARHDGAHFLVRHILAIAAGRQRIGDADRRLHAKIGADQHILEFLQRVFVQLALGEDAGDRRGQFLRRARQPALQPLEPGELFLRLRRRRRVFDPADIDLALAGGDRNVGSNERFVRFCLG